MRPSISLCLSLFLSLLLWAHTILLKMSPDGAQDKQGGSIVGRMFVQLLTGTAGINHKRIFLWQATWGRQQKKTEDCWERFLQASLLMWPIGRLPLAPPPAGWQGNLLLPFVHIFFMCCEPFIDISLALCVKLLAAPLEISPFAFDGRRIKANRKGQLEKKTDRERERGREGRENRERKHQ